MGNLNKDEETKPTGTTALKVAPARGPLSTRMKIPPFGPHFIKFSKTVSYEVNLASQSTQSEAPLKSKFLSKREILIFVINGPLVCQL